MRFQLGRLASVGLALVVLAGVSIAAGPTPQAAPAKGDTVAPVLPRLVDLGAGKCIPCKKMAPILEELQKKYAGIVDVVFIDVWKDPKAGKPYKIRLIPTQVFFDRSGKEVFRHEGFLSKEEIEQVFREKMGVAPPPAAEDERDEDSTERAPGFDDPARADSLLAAWGLEELPAIALIDREGRPYWGDEEEIDVLDLRARIEEQDVMSGLEGAAEALARTIEESAALAPLAAFVGGVLTALNPCVLAMIPLMVGFAAGVAGRSAETTPGRRVWPRTLGFSLLFVVGFALELAVLFTVFAAAATWLQASWWEYILVAICVVVGLHLLEVLHLPAAGGYARMRPAAGAFGAVALGFLFGLVSLPCTGPVLLLLIGLAPKVGAAQAGTLLFLYGLGHSMLIVVAGTSVGAAATLVGARRLHGAARRLRQAAGIIVLVGAVWILLT